MREVPALEGDDPVRLRIFLASPDDVAEERRIAYEVIDALSKRGWVRNRVWLQVIAYDDPHAPPAMSAHETPQASFIRQARGPAECDLTIVILWSKLGTPLPPEIRRRDGRGYESGTVWELEDAADREAWVYRRTVMPKVDLMDRDIRKKQAEYRKVERFFRRFRNSGGSLNAGVNRYAETAEFKSLLEKHLDDFVHRRLESLAPGASPSTFAGAAKVPLDYFQWLRDKCEAEGIELLEMKSEQPLLARLSQLYVPLTTPARTARLEGDATKQRGRRRPGEAERPSHELLLARLNEESIYASGPPGCGKSTFCRWVAWLVANGSPPEHRVRAPESFEEPFPEALAGLLPVLVPLRDFWAGRFEPGQQTWSREQLEGALAEWVDVRRPGDLTGAHLRQHLQSGSALLLLDGVDEVPELHVAPGAEAPAHPRACFLSGLADAVPRWHDAGVRVLLTSRPYGLSPDEERRVKLSQAPVSPLAPELQTLFVERWFAVADPDARAGKAKGLLAHVAGRDDLAPLTESPMLLTALCVRYGEGRRLPDDQHQLYDTVVNNVLYHRYPGGERERDKVRLRLAAVAYGMHTGDAIGEPRRSPLAEVGLAEVDAILQRISRVSPTTDSGIDYVVDRREDLLSYSGLLLPKAGHQRAGFQHLSFQEFLAAEYLARNADATGIVTAFRQRAGEPGWRLTLVFLWALLAFRHRTQEWAVDLLRRLGADLDRAAVRESPAAALVIADCLEIALRKELELGELREQFRGICLGAIEDEVRLPERLRLGLVLGRLGDPRIADARDLDAYVKVPAGRYPYQEGETTDIAQPFLIGRYPVTNSQYRRFMEDGGYDPKKPWWSKGGRKWLRKEKPDEPNYWRDRRFNGENQPVVGVSWYEAEAFCNWVGRALRREARLPSEREWEAAARGPAGHEYPWGGPWEDGICASYEAKLGQTAPVGLFPRSRQVDLGLEDMAGNVWEWTRDVDKDGQPWLRGGSWDYGERSCRAAYRYCNRPDMRLNLSGDGCRVVVGCVRQD